MIIAAACPHQPCPNVKPCPDHRSVDLRSSTARGYGREHRALRRQVLTEDPWCSGFPRGAHELVGCVACVGTVVGCRDHREPSTVMDHIVSMRNGGRTLRSNVRGTCTACNARKAVRVEGARPR